MENKKTELRWYGIGASVIGANHQRAKQPNQDAISWFPPDAKTGPAGTILLAMSDGHGRAKYIRSDEGARIAVETMITILRDLLVGTADTGGETSRAIGLSVIKQLAEEKIPQLLVREWSERVREQVREHPFTTKETTPLLEREGAATVDAVQNNPILAYGTTIIAVAITPSFILYLQLGDGDILVVSERGEVSRPISEDKRLFANETTSLCTRHAWRDMRFAVQPVQDMGHIPALILVATDGYNNSFQNEAAFLKVGSDIRDLLYAEGIEKVRTSLKGWLEQATQDGSGDDITVGIICRGDVVKQPNFPIVHVPVATPEDPQTETTEYNNNTDGDAQEPSHEAAAGGGDEHSPPLATGDDSQEPPQATLTVDDAQEPSHEAAAGGGDEHSPHTH
jgi:serine/threonine protein phosphatase PrpC